MAIVSTRLADGQQSTITQYNNLRADILAHDHSAGEGGAVDHGDLTDGVISGTYLNHEEINDHIQGAGTSATPDDPGGDKGVHGLPVPAYVAGSLANQLIIQVGTGTTDTFAIITGSYGDQYEDITFPTAFGASPTPKVFIMTTETTSARIAVTNLDENGFRALLGFPFGDKATQQENCGFMWIAVGVAA